MELLLPKGRRPAPAVLFFHGGAWRFGSKDDLPPLAARLLEKGIALASADYRPSTEASFPAQLEDARCALRYLRQHAAEHGVDPARIGAWGESSGGHLAALLATTAREPGERVRAVADSFGPTDLARLRGPLAGAVKLLLGDPAHAADASPLFHVRAGLPPFLLVHGERDQVVPPDQSRSMLRALQRAGGEATLMLMPGLPHGSYDRSGEDAIVQFFVGHLGSVAR